MTTKRYILRDNHSTSNKLQQLNDLAEQLGLSLSFYGHRAVVTDVDFPGVTFYLEDLDGG